MVTSIFFPGLRPKGRLNSVLYGRVKSTFMAFKPCPKRQILDSSKLKEFADDNFKFDENRKKVI